ncbi:unnamed protein product [Prorocentrum cordatum]|uniref:Uncharacterized protein n=1 Tax=Prorocentrum cordatum TaxID=2364126 RepID=A0ABN9UX24_9DINO|nr:unnamed protein product [Polarella glacialis]
MHWCRRRRMWPLHFANVKLAGDEKKLEVFDVLLSVFDIPRGIYIYEDHLVFCVSTCGRTTHVSGHRIVVMGRSGQGWNTALRIIVALLDEPSNTCKSIAEVSLQDARVQSTEAHHTSSSTLKVFECVPLA